MGITLPSTKQWVYIVNLLIIFLYAFGGLIFVFEGQPFIRGFYCDDENISKPYPKQQTVPTLESIIIIAVVCVICVCVGEYIKLEEKKKLCGGDTQYLKSWIINVTCFLLLCIYGVSITMFVTDIGKYTIGRLRPHFLDACKPDWSRINCTNTNGIKNYIIGDQFCTTDNRKVLKEARLSFPSGHSSSSGFGATFIIFYIQDQIAFEKWGSVGKLFLQVAVAGGAFYIGLTRVSNYMHHPTDVLTGFVIGIFIGVVLRFTVIRMFFPPIKRKREHEEDIIDRQISIHSVDIDVA